MRLAGQVEVELRPPELWRRVWIQTRVGRQRLRRSLPGFWFMRWMARRPYRRLLMHPQKQPRVGLRVVALAADVEQLADSGQASLSGRRPLSELRAKPGAQLTQTMC